MANYTKFGFKSEQEARDYLYEIYRTMDLDVRNPSANPRDALAGTEEKWVFPNGFLRWTLLTPEFSSQQVAAGEAQHPALVHFSADSQVPPDKWDRLWNIAQAYHGAALS